jgi:hypothetical protein
MKALIVLSAATALLAASPAFANPDWTLKSPIKVTPSSIPDTDGTIVKMVPGARSGATPPDISYATPAQLAPAKTSRKPRLERRKP